MKQRGFCVKRLGKKFLAVVLLMGLILSLSGCSVESGDALASLPRLPGEYLALQQQVDAILAQGYIPAVAESGQNRQAMQQQDIDGDGQKEIISFYRSSTSGEYMIYVHKRQGDDYMELGHAKGYGRYLKEVSYPRCQNNGARAIALSWGMEDDSASGMSVHTLGSDGLNEALAVRYSNSYIADVDYDGVDEIFLTAFDRVGGAMVMTAYGFRNGTCTEISQTPLSSDVKNVVKITKSTTPGQWGLSLYVDSLAATGGYITDIVELRSGVLTNTTLGSGSKRSAATWRPVNITCQDIDNDGIPEVPLADMLPGYTDPEAADTMWKLRWTRFENGGANGVAIETFHAPADGWYFQWPETWGSNVSAQRKSEAGIIKTTFLVPVEGAEEGYLFQGENNVLLQIWMFTGDNRQEYFASSGMEWLHTSDNAIYGYSLPENGYPQLSLGADQVARSFHAITKEWTSEVFS